MVKEPWQIDGNIENWEFLVVSMGSKSFNARFFEFSSGAEALKKLGPSVEMHVESVAKD